jgi:hypothetical protein
LVTTAGLTEEAVTVPVTHGTSAHAVRSVSLCFAEKAERLTESALSRHDMRPRHDPRKGERIRHREKIPATARMRGKARQHLMSLGQRRSLDQHVAHTHSSPAQIP